MQRRAWYGGANRCLSVELCAAESVSVATNNNNNNNNSNNNNNNSNNNNNNNNNNNEKRHHRPRRHRRRHHESSSSSSWNHHHESSSCSIMNHHHLRFWLLLFLFTFEFLLHVPIMNCIVNLSIINSDKFCLELFGQSPVCDTRLYFLFFDCH